MNAIKVAFSITDKFVRMSKPRLFSSALAFMLFGSVHSHHQIQNILHSTAFFPKPPYNAMEIIKISLLITNEGKVYSSCT